MRKVTKLETLVKYKRVQDAYNYLCKSYPTTSQVFRTEVINKHFSYRQTPFNEPLMRAVGFEIPAHIANECVESDALALDYLIGKLRAEREKRA